MYLPYLYHLAKKGPRRHPGVVPSKHHYSEERRQRNLILKSENGRIQVSFLKGYLEPGQKALCLIAPLSLITRNVYQPREALSGERAKFNSQLVEIE